MKKRNAAVLAFCAMRIHQVLFLACWRKLLILAITFAIPATAQQTATPKQSTPVKPGPTSSQPSGQSAAQPSAGSPTSLPPGPTPAADPGASLPADTPVITLSNICAKGAGAECKTVITKGEFENLVTAGSARNSLSAPERTRIVQPFAQIVVLDVTAE